MQMRFQKISSFVDAHMALQLARGNQSIVLSYYEGMLKFVSCYKYDFDSLSFIKTQPDINIPLPIWPDINLSAHCNGIICFSTLRTDTLINPALGELKSLPPIPIPIPIPIRGNRLLGRDYLVATGFGFDDAKMDYKVVRVHGTAVPVPNTSHTYSVSWEAYIYNLRSNSWRNLGAKLPLSSDNYFRANVSIFFKGSLHWIIREKERFAILTFNMTTELHDEMTLPFSLINLCARMYVFRNSTIACASRNIGPYWKYPGKVWNMEVWVMKEYGVAESWTKLCSISDQPSLNWPIAFWENDKILFQTKHGDFNCYHLPTGQLDSFQQPEGSERAFSFQCHVCNLSFASINQPVEEET